MAQILFCLNSSLQSFRCASFPPTFRHTDCAQNVRYGQLHAAVKLLQNVLLGVITTGVIIRLVHFPQSSEPPLVNVFLMSELPSDEVLAAALAFIDAFDEQDSSTPSSPSSQSSMSYFSETATRNQQAKRTRNESRERQKQELLRLRMEAHQLEQQLQELRGRHAEKQTQREQHDDRKSPTPDLHNYRVRAIHERQRRKRAEQQNEALRQRVERQWSLAMKLDRTMKRYIRTIQEVEEIFEAASGESEAIHFEREDTSTTRIDVANSSLPTMNTASLGDLFLDEPFEHTDILTLLGAYLEEATTTRQSQPYRCVRGCTSTYPERPKSISRLFTQRKHTTDFAFTSASPAAPSCSRPACLPLAPLRFLLAPSHFDRAHLSPFLLRPSAQTPSGLESRQLADRVRPPRMTS